MFIQRKAIVIVLVAVFLAGLTSCNEPDILGLDLQPTDELVGVNRIDTFDLYSFVTPEDSLQTSRLQDPLFFGNLNEQAYYGTTHGGFAMQLRIGNTMSSDIFDNVNACDSIVMTFAWRTHYGDTNSLHHLTVHRLGESLYPDSIYYSNRAFTTDAVLGHLDFVPDIEDSVIIDSVAFSPHFRMPLDPAFGTKLIQDFKSNPADFSSQASFLNYFKGIVLVDSVDGAGSFITLEPSSALNRVVLYYEGNKSYEFVLDNASARYNYFRHNYNSDLQDTTEDSRFVVESMAGLKTRIKIPYLLELKNKLGTIAINNAQIIFNLESGTDPAGFDPHDVLLLYGSDSTGKNQLLIDQTESALYIGGIYNKTSKNYTFNISRYVQQVLSGKPDYGLNLVAGGSVSNSRRTLLQGGANVRFIITYTLVNP